jgi:hypothetical protein
MNIKINDTLFVEFTSRLYDSELQVVSNYSRINAVNINSLNISEEYVVEYESSLDDLLKGLTQEKAHVLNAFKSQFFRSVITPIYKWVNGIEHAISLYSPKIIDFGEIYESNYIFTYEAEGEVNRKWLYESNYFIPHLLLPYFIAKYPKIKFIYKKKNSRKIAFRFYLRNYIYLSMSHCVALLRYSKKFFELSDKVEVRGKIGLLVRNSIQSEFALKLYDFFKNKYYLINYEQVTSVDKNSKYLKRKNKPFFDVSDNISLLQIVKDYSIGVVSLLKKTDIGELSLLGGTLKIPMDYALKDMRIRSLDFISYAKGVSNLKGHKIISFDMFTAHAHFVASAIGTQNVTQIQTTLISPKVETNFIAGRNFIFTDGVAYSEFLRLNKRFSSKVLVMDNPKFLIGDKKNNLTAKQSKVVYFSQPFELDSEKGILIALKKILINNGLKLTIKLHPRQKKNDYYFLDNVDFCTDEISVNDYYFAITRTSSIAIDCWASNMPIIFIRETITARNTEATYIPKGYIGDLSCINDIIDIINNFYNFIDEFISVRNMLNLNADAINIDKTIKKSLNYET